MGTLFGDDIRPLLDACPDLHKLQACQDALRDHDFKKPVIFVDRVAVASRLATVLAHLPFGWYLTAVRQ
jgi:hypothetical protein